MALVACRTAIAISVLPGVKHLKVKCLAQGQNIYYTISQRLEGRNQQQAATLTKLRALAIAPRPSANMCDLENMLMFKKPFLFVMCLYSLKKSVFVYCVRYDSVA